MKHHTHGMHHFHTRKRMFLFHDKYPHRENKWKKFLDYLIYFVGIAGPVMTLPQVYEVWVHKKVAGLSPLTWISYTVLSVFWLLYGMAHHERPIIIANILWIIMNGLIVVGIYIV